MKQSAFCKCTPKFSPLVILSFCLMIINGDCALLDNLVIYYDFEQTSGNRIDDKSSSANANHADVIGQNLAAASAAGVIGNAYSKPATDTDYAVIDASPGNGAHDSTSAADLLFGNQPAGTDFTIACWVDTTNVADTARPFQNIDWNLSGGSALRSGIGLYRNSSSNWHYRVHYTGNTSGSDMGNGQLTGWQYFTIVGDRNGSVRYYINGTLRSTRTMLTGAIGDAAQPFLFGRNQTLNAVWNADTAYDEFAVWHRTLSISEIQMIYTQNNQGINLLNVTPPLPPSSAEMSVTSEFAPFHWTEDIAPIAFNVIIENTGSSELIIQPNQTITGADAAEFAFDASYNSATTQTIATTSSIAVPFIWTPLTNTGIHKAIFNYSHNDSSTTNPFTFELQTEILPRNAIPLAMKNDLVVHLQFEETSGTIAKDSTERGNHGDVLGAAMQTEAGIIGNAYRSPANQTDYVALDNAPQNGANDNSLPPDLLFGDKWTGTDFSVSAWVYLHQTYDALSPILGNVNFSETDTLNLNGVALAELGSYETAPFGDKTPVNPFPTNVWKHYLIVCDRNCYVRLYIDGKLFDESTHAELGEVGDSGMPFIIGNNALPAILGNPANVTVDDVAIWRRAIEPWEAWYIFWAGQNGDTFTDYDTVATSSLSTNHWSLY